MVVRQQKEQYFSFMLVRKLKSAVQFKGMCHHPSDNEVSDLVHHFSWHIEIKKCTTTTTISIYPLSLVRLVPPIIRTRAMQLSSLPQNSRCCTANGNKHRQLQINNKRYSFSCDSKLDKGNAIKLPYSLLCIPGWFLCSS